MTRQLWTLYDVACPFCGAGIDGRCIVRGSKTILATPHVARRVAFQVARAGEDLLRERATTS